MSVSGRFGANLVHCRKRVGMSQDELGFRAGLHRTEVSQLERGLRIPRIDTLAKLAGALDIDADDLLEGIVWEPSEVRLGGFVDGGADRRASLERPFQKVVRTVE